MYGVKPLDPDDGGIHYHRLVGSMVYAFKRVPIETWSQLVLVELLKPRPLSEQSTII